MCNSLRGAFGVMRNALEHPGRLGLRVLSAFIATAFAQDDAEAPPASRGRRVGPTMAAARTGELPCSGCLLTGTRPCPIAAQPQAPLTSEMFYLESL